MSKTSGFLVVSHAHPDFSKGGGELAAYNTFKGLKLSHPDKDVRFLAAGPADMAPGAIYEYRPGEFLFGSYVTDYRLSSGNPAEFGQMLKSFADGFAPELISVHHYFRVGCESIALLRRFFPDARIALTFHEMLAICSNDGQMIKRGSRSLCFEANPFACNSCTGLPVSAVAVRRNTLQSLFDLVDVFVSPSEFVRDRYVSWGLPASKFVVIENGQEVPERTHEPAAPRKSPNRFGYFGQINPYKGVDVLLGAAATMVREGFEDFVIEINGANLSTQSSDYQTEITKLLEPLLESGNVLWNGPYGREELPDRIERVDWVVMPSVWWENSPMVIQEAYLSGRPVICSGIGGMAEKVIDGKYGFHVPVGSTRGWADIMRRAATDTEAHRRMAASLPTPPNLQKAAAEYAQLSKETPHVASQ